MERLILIETSTSLCSAALAENGEVVSYKESSAPKAHASLTAVFIQEMLAERGLTVADCDAVCVSMGPGSYTGLRVGVSTAKGLCFGSGKPLLAVGTLDTLVAQASTELAKTSVGDSADVMQNSSLHVTPDSPHVIKSCRSFTSYASAIKTSFDCFQLKRSVPGLTRNLVSDFHYIVPMVDARRMEVYSAVFTPEGQQITETAPVIVDETSFAAQLADGPTLFIGDGAGKCADVITHPNASFLQCSPNAAAMLAPALKAYRAARFEDVAYFEPFYLKEFVATVSKKKLF